MHIVQHVMMPYTCITFSMSWCHTCSSKTCVQFLVWKGTPTATIACKRYLWDMCMDSHSKIFVAKKLTLIIMYIIETAKKNQLDIVRGVSLPMELSQGVTQLFGLYWATIYYTDCPDAISPVCNCSMCWSNGHQRALLEWNNTEGWTKYRE